MVGTRKFIYSKIDSGVTKYPQLFGGEEIVKNKFKDNELLSYAKICDFGYCWRTPYEIKHQIYKPDADTLEFINFDIGNDAVHYCQYRKIL
jgi:hypothetical protein